MKRRTITSEFIIRALAVFAAAAVALALLAGCSGGKTPGTEGTGTASATDAPADAASGGETESDAAASAPDRIPTAIDAEVGGTFTFGKYEQDGNEGNGAEDIEWIVLSKEDGRILALSKYSLNSMEFNSSDEGTTWDNSTIKAWLNGEFYDGAFSDAEKAMISESEAGRVFLLTAEEAETLFETDADRISGGTEYAYSLGLFRTDDGGVWWWLRTAGDKDGYFIGVDGNGLINASGNTAHRIKHGVRPAILINQ